jgi:hypothetical protein
MDSRQKLKDIDIREFNLMSLVLMRDDAITDVHLAIRRWGLSKRGAQSLATTGIAELKVVASSTTDPILRYAGSSAFELMLAQVKAKDLDEMVLISGLSHLASVPLKSEP